LTSHPGLVFCLYIFVASIIFYENLPKYIESKYLMMYCSQDVHRKYFYKAWGKGLYMCPSS
jgi:hypothetical protein